MKRVMIFIIATAFLWLSYGIAHSDELIFSDDFERADIGGDWTTGAFCDSDTITIVDGRVQATENCNYIETVQEFSGNLRIEVDVEKVGPSDHGCWDFAVLLTELIEYSGIILFDSGGVDGVAIDNEPGNGCGDDVTIPSGVNIGTAIFTYQDGIVRFSFENNDGAIIDAGSVCAGNFDSSRIRIHLAAHPDTPRYVDNVKVYSLPEGPDFNVALNATVTLHGAPFFEGGWGGGQIVSKDTVVDGIFLPRGQQWDQGPVWWDSTDEEDRYIEINLDDEYTINSLIVQADDNDAYKLLYYWDLTNNNWQLAWDVPNFDAFGWGMQTRPNPDDDTERYCLSNPITTDALLFKGNMDDSDRLFSVSEIQAYGRLDNQPPEAICQDVTVPTESGLCTADASIDDGSFDPDGDEITLDQTPPGPYDLGDTDVTLTVTDDKEASDECTATVTVVDEEDPVISSVSASPNELWPPNHKMVPVTVTVNATDNCDSTCQIISVASNEPVNGLGDGDTAPDWVKSGDLTVKLRAERSGKGNGRVYTITVECADQSGNSSTDTATVTVPHDKSKNNKQNNKKKK